MEHDSIHDGASSSSKIPVARSLNPGDFEYSADSDFPLDEPVTLTLRGSSGAYLNGRVMRAMEVQHAAFAEAYVALDRLIVLIRDCTNDHTPAPP